MSNIDLGDSPVGTPPTNEQLTQMRSLIAPTSELLVFESLPVNGRIELTNTAELRPDGTNIVTGPIDMYFSDQHQCWITEDLLTSGDEFGWFSTSTPTGWSLAYYEGYYEVGYWVGVGGVGTDPSDPDIIWGPGVGSTALGTPVFVAGQSSGSTVGIKGQKAHYTVDGNTFRYECIDVLPYTWQPDYSLTAKSTPPSEAGNSVQWFDETSFQIITRVNGDWIGQRYDIDLEKLHYTRRLAANMTAQVDSRLAGKNPATALALFTGLASNSSATTFTQNTDCWLHSLRSQLCGFHMNANGYTQSYGLLPLGGRFFLCVAHNGPGIAGETIRFPKSDGGTFTTTISRVFKDSSPRKVNDYCIFVMADPAPATLSVIPIVKLDVNETIMASLDPPTVYVSQGASSATGFKQPTPQNRKCAVMSYSGWYYSTFQSALREPFGHSVSVGDSNCPQYLLINNLLYLYKMNMSPDYPIYTKLNYLQDLVNRAAAAEGIAPITIQVVTNPPV